MNDFDKFVELIREVHSKCPYLKGMSPASMLLRFESEMKEFKDALLSWNNEAIIDELGDILFHLVFVILSAESYEVFTVEDVLKHAIEKYTRRNVHVFRENPAKTVREAIESWKEQKRLEKENA